MGIKNKLTATRGEGRGDDGGRRGRSQPRNMNRGLMGWIAWGGGGGWGRREKWGKRWDNCKLNNNKFKKRKKEITRS